MYIKILLPCAATLLYTNANTIIETTLGIILMFVLDIAAIISVNSQE